MTEISINYHPPGPVAARFLADMGFVTGLMGPIGSGKSVSCAIKILRLACMQKPGPDGIRHTRWAIIRNTYPELLTTTVKTWHEWIPMEMGHWQSQGPPTHFIKIKDLDIEVMFLALDRPDDIKKLLSLELTGAWINEARELPKAILDTLTGRVGRYPAMRHGGCTWSGIMMDTNPPDTDHWWYRLAEVQNPVGYSFHHQPSGRSEDAENRKNLPKPYYDRLLAGKDPDWINVYVDGNYGYVRDGKPVYPEWNDSVHCQPCEVNESLPIYIGLDFGLTPAAAFAQRDILGRWKVFDELVTENMGAVRFGELLREKMNLYDDRADGFEIWGDPKGDDRSESDESTPFEILRGHEINIQAYPAPTNDPVIRREAVATTLTRLIDGKPGLVISPKCVTLRKAMQGAYNYKRIQVAGEERYVDKPMKNKYSHVAEALQYLMIGAGEGKLLVKRHHRGQVQQKALSNYDEMRLN